MDSEWGFLPVTSGDWAGPSTLCYHPAIPDLKGKPNQYNFRPAAGILRSVAIPVKGKSAHCIDCGFTEAVFCFRCKARVREKLDSFLPGFW